MNTIPLTQYLDACCAIAQEAGTLIMRYYHEGFDTSHKSDKSPVTDADIAANTHITKALTALSPSIPVIAEEDEVMGSTEHAVFWLVDPLDGTRSFVKGEPEFTVNIGLIRDKKPILGVIYAPAQGLLYYGAKGQGAFRASSGGRPQPITARAPSQDGVVVVCSKSHPSKATSAFLETLNVKELKPGSSSIKMCLVADGSADIYPRFGRTMEWDTAAGHAIVNEAGGRVETTSGEALAYGKPGFENPGFIVYGK